MCYFDISEYLLTLYLEPNTSEKTSEILEYAQTMLLKVSFESNDKVLSAYQEECRVLLLRSRKSGGKSNSSF